MASKSGSVFVIGAKRTAFGTFGGKLKDFTTIDLGEVASKAALEHANVAAKDIDHVIFGNVLQSSKGAIYGARHIGLRVGVPVNVGALTVNRLCGSGFQAIVNGAQQIKLGEAYLVLTGGTESMTQTPFAVRNIRFGTALGANYKFEDLLWEGLYDPHAKLLMGETAEKLGAQYNIRRAESDAFALRSQHSWKKAQDNGIFKAEIAPLKVKTKKGEEVFDVDEHPRPTTAEGLAKLKPVFQKDGLVNAGSASGVADGAAALILASEEAVKIKGLKPLARVLAYSAVGCDPTIMGIGPVSAVNNVLKYAGLKLADIDIIEINEAFAAQVLSVQKELGVPLEKLNANGGAIALGHPLGASGARISGHIVHELGRRNVKYGLGSACIGGGQGIAVLFENVN